MSPESLRRTGKNWREISEEEKAVVRDRSPENGSASDAG
jgi:hypothetical protein